MGVAKEHYFNASLCGSAGHSRGAQDVVLSRNKALSFHKRFIGDNNIDEECYGEESCDFEEVVEKFDHSEQTVGTHYYMNKNGALECLLLKLHTRLALIYY